MSPCGRRLAGSFGLVVLTWVTASAIAPEAGHGQPPGRPRPDAIAPVSEWTTEGNLSGALLGPVDGAGDVNGDGYDDLVVGAPYYNGQGRAFVFLGSASGLAASPVAVLESAYPYQSFGQAVASAGDVNGDGYDDVVVGSPNNGYGWVELFRGGPGGVETRPSWARTSPYSVAGFGWSVHGAGDVNGDGYDDVVVGSRGDEAYVFHGSASGLSTPVRWRGTSPQAGIYYGETVAGAGDVNRDGYDDVVVGARLYANGQATEGAAFVYHGSAAGVTSPRAWMAEGNEPLAWLGTSVDGAGDVNGDGYDDVLVGAQQYGYGGGAFVFHGSPSGLSPGAAWVVHSVAGTWNLGSSVSAAGDVDGNGSGDVLLGAHVRPRGKALLFLGSGAGLGGSEAWRGQDGQSDSDYGLTVAGVGDVNGDGRSEIAVGARAFDNGQTNEGRVVVYTFPPGPALPRLSVADVGATEGSSGQTPLLFKVTLEAPSARPVSVRYATADGTATAGYDYLATAGRLTIPAGAVEGTVAVPVLGDADVEPAEVFSLRLWDPENATVARGQATATIPNDDVPLVSVYPIAVDEGSSGAWFALVSVGLSAASDQPVTVEFTLRDGTAVAGLDYVPAVVRMGVPVGWTLIYVWVGILGDHAGEAEETLEAVLSSPTNARLGQASATLTIRDDDAPGLSVEDVSVAEAASGDVDAVFTVSLYPPPTETVTVDYATADGTAAAGADYGATSGRLSFPAQATTATIRVPVHADAEREAPETFTLALSSAAGAAVSRAQAVGTIVNPGFFTVAPCRVLDTRSGNSPALVAGADRRFVIAGACGVPAGATAVSINITATEPTTAGNIRVYPGAAALPLTSSVNYTAGLTRANNMIVRLGPNGEVTVRCQQASGSAHFVLDVNGYFR